MFRGRKTWKCYECCPMYRSPEIDAALRAHTCIDRIEIGHEKQ